MMRYAKPCNGRCEDFSVHDAHLTLWGRFRLTRWWRCGR